MHASTDTKRLWIKNIPKRQDREFDFGKCYVCFKHFEEKFLVKTTVINSVLNIVVNRKKWTLTPDAVPTIFESSRIPTYLSKVSKPRRPPLERKAPRTIENSKICVQAEQLEGEDTFNVTAALKDGFEIPLPTDWTFKLEVPYVTFTKLTEMNSEIVKSFFVERCVRLSDQNRTELLIRGIHVEYSLPQVRSMEDLIECIQVADSIQLCSGAGQFGMFEKFPGAFLCAKVWFSSNCRGVTDKDICMECKDLQTLMRKDADRILKEARRDCNRERQNISQEASQVHKLRKRGKRNLQRLTRAQKKNTLLKAECKAWRTKFRTSEIKCLNDAIDKTELTPKQKLAFKTAVSLQKAKGVSGRR